MKFPFMLSVWLTCHNEREIVVQVHFNFRFLENSYILSTEFVSSKQLRFDHIVNSRRRDCISWMKNVDLDSQTNHKNWIVSRFMLDGRHNIVNENLQNSFMVRNFPRQIPWIKIIELVRNRYDCLYSTQNIDRRGKLVKFLAGSSWNGSTVDCLEKMKYRLFMNISLRSSSKWLNYIAFHSIVIIWILSFCVYVFPLKCTFQRARGSIASFD